VKQADSGETVLGRESRIGMPGELLFSLGDDGLLFATFVHHRSAVSRLLWAGVRRAHVRTCSDFSKEQRAIALPPR
jgi:hypothetical protein